ncbi:MAG: ribosomal protein S18-alanine N-acetyltransferase [Chloroflexi bacterium]|nr:ribosomal protein S18-alanine N-acetyltransferase [Chloroflexota bacterium]
MIAILPRYLIREMTLEDIPTVLEIDRVSFSNPWPERSYRYELTENRAAQLFVAKMDDGGVIAYLGYWLIGDEAHISTFAVHPEFRMQGIGEDMLKSALAAAAEKGARVATLEVRESNDLAIRLYEKLGFEVVGSRDSYYRDNNEDAILMTLAGISNLAREGDQ